MKHYFKKTVPVLDVDFDAADPYLSELGLRVHATQFDDGGRNAVLDWVN